MSRVWPWVFGIVTGLAILALIGAGGSSRQAYRAAHRAIQHRAEMSQPRINAPAGTAQPAGLQLGR